MPRYAFPAALFAAHAPKAAVFLVSPGAAGVLAAAAGSPGGIRS
ncbi:hypothetical protein [Streptomyces sp. NPDC014894]